MRTVLALLLTLGTLSAQPLGMHNGAFLGACKRAPSLYWLSSSNVTGSPCSAWQSVIGNITLAQGTGTNQPSVTANAFGTTTGLTFDGVSDVLTVTPTPISRTISGSMSVVFKTPATITGPVAIVSQSDASVANDWWEFGIAADGKLYVDSNAAGTQMTVEGSTVLVPSTPYNALVVYDGVDFYVLLNGVEENPLTITSIGAFSWIGRITGTQTFSVGATITSAGTVRPFAGVVGAVYFWNSDLTR